MLLHSRCLRSSLRLASARWRLNASRHSSGAGRGGVVPGKHRAPSLPTDCGGGRLPVKKIEKRVSESRLRFRTAEYSVVHRVPVVCTQDLYAGVWQLCTYFVCSVVLYVSGKSSYEKCGAGEGGSSHDGGCPCSGLTSSSTPSSACFGSLFAISSFMDVQRSSFCRCCAAWHTHKMQCCRGDAGVVAIGAVGVHGPHGLCFSL